jgi:hypothetical protein
LAEPFLKSFKFCSISSSFISFSFFLNVLQTWTHPTHDAYYVLSFMQQSDLFLISIHSRAHNQVLPTLTYLIYHLPILPCLHFPVILQPHSNLSSAFLDLPILLKKQYSIRIAY